MERLFFREFFKDELSRTYAYTYPDFRARMNVRCVNNVPDDFFNNALSGRSFMCPRFCQISVVCYELPVAPVVKCVRCGGSDVLGGYSAHESMLAIMLHVCRINVSSNVDIDVDMLQIPACVTMLAPRNLSYAE